MVHWLLGYIWRRQKQYIALVKYALLKTAVCRQDFTSAERSVWIGPFSEERSRIRSQSKPGEAEDDTMYHSNVNSLNLHSLVSERQICLKYIICWLSHILYCCWPIRICPFMLTTSRKPFQTRIETVKIVLYFTQGDSWRLQRSMPWFLCLFDKCPCLCIIVSIWIPRKKSWGDSCAQRMLMGWKVLLHPK